MVVASDSHTRTVNIFACIPFDIVIMVSVANFMNNYVFISNFQEIFAVGGHNCCTF